MSDGGGGEDGGGGMEVSAAVQTVADASVLQKHFRKLVPLLLEDGGDAPASLETALEEKSALEQMRKFLSDPQIHSILVERSALKEDVGDEGEEERECISYSISIDIHYGLKSNSLALIKRTGVIDADKPISTQVRVLTLSEDSPYETLHSFISNAVSPYFKSYIRESGKADRDGDKMAPSVEKKIAELEMGLLHLQQNIEIPEISLLIHPIITNVAKQCYERAEKPKVTDFGDKVEDPSFLNQLQSGVNRWIREIQKVTKLDRDPASGTALQEISFWLNLERALNRIQEKRESPEVLLTLDILKHGKRFHATVSFDTDTGLKQAVETVNDYNPLMKDFPLNDLLSATELDKIRQALVAIFNHLRKIRNTKYPIQRALRLVEAISRDLSSQLLKVLGTRKLMHVAYEEFEKVMVACFEVFQTWEDEYEKLQVLLRDIVKRKREENLKMVWRLSPAHRKLQARLDHMRRFRRQHEQLRAVIVRVLRPQVSAVSQHAQGKTAEPDDMKVAEVLFDAADVNAIEEVNLAYENVKEVDGLDVSKEGVEAWEAAMKRYDERIDRVETRITARLRDQLGTAKNANEMFRIFSRFNALFVRPHIRGAIREYQTQLIQRVKDDIEALHDKFKVQYPQSQSCKMSHVRDLPPVSGSIIWAKQIDRQLTAYMKRVEDVLGKGWENHVEGLKLKQDGDSFRAKLNTQEIFDDWAKKVQQRNLGVSGRIFTIENTRARGRTGTVLKLKVNFLPEIITLSKEVRNLKWLSFRVPLAIVNKAHQANQLYPFAISLIESVRTYERTCEKVEERMSISLLVAGLKKEVQALVTEGISLVWESYKLDPYVQRLAETVFNFQEKVDDLLLLEEKIDLEVRSLETCMYENKMFTEILSRIQKAVDDLNLHSYSNLPIWVNKLDIEIERILGVRLQAGLKAWTQVLMGQMEDKADVDMDTEAPQVSHKPGGDPKIKNVIHELRITNQVIYLNPPIEDCRYRLYQEMFAWKMVILSLPRIQSQRYQVGVHYELSEEEKFYRNALTRMPDGPSALEEAYNAVKEIVSEVEQYVKVVPLQASLFLTHHLEIKLYVEDSTLVNACRVRVVRQVALEELQDLKGVWSELSKVWEQIDQMKEQPWVSVQPRKLRQSLDALLNQLKNFPARLRQYASYEYVQRLLKGYMKVNMLVIELKSEALKDRHWKQLMKRLHVNWVLSELSLGQIWDVDLQKNEMVVKDVLLVAQGEMALEEFLKQLKPLMKKVTKPPLVMDVLNIQGVQRSLERLADLLGKIQKALGEYLERERSSFPRFYFVGDEDLLEIIGNSKNVAKLQKHFKKMFAGVSSILLNEDNTEVLGISSREGEEVLYKTPVSITEHPKINEWLTLVEREMRVTLAKLLAESVTEVGAFNKSTGIDLSTYINWIDRYQAQLVVLSTQIDWSENVESALTTIGGGEDMGPLQAVLANVKATLNLLADTVLMEQPPLRRKKLEHLITELVHQRDVTRTLIKNKIDNPKSFEWLSQMRFYFDPKQTDVLQQLSIQMANAKFNYGFEYLGVQEKLVQTPLTDRCYLTMTQALEARLGGSPFGPAGTGKTESVKALGHQLGRFVLVFNCDETFDFQAMGRIFVGLCQVGAWGCFDEFNRLEERMLSAVSQQVQYIQVALREHSNPNRDRSVPVTTELLNKQVKVSAEMAIFITMNPGYAGRSNLPDNLKKLFRSLAMTKPDRQLIAQVMLYSQGFRTAEILAKKIVPFFKLCDEQLSSQSHYDFGLRALKSVLISAGNVKRERIQKIKREKRERGEDVDENEIAENLPEQEILIQSVCETMVPKLVAEDIPLLFSLLSDVFPGVQYMRGEMTALREELRKVCAEMYLTYGDGDDVGSMWVEKVLQLYQITQINHGLMMVGPSGSGKTMAWRVLLKALERLEGLEGVAHIIDPKAISKDHLYGTLDPNTREWTDGLFTHVLRKIIDNVRGELQKRQWIIFDGDVDPEWVENLNSVLDDNKLLTLPNGERLSLPPNVRIMFEVQDLKYATLATVSRCGMVWFSEDVLSTDMIFNNFLARLRSIPLDEGEDEAQRMRKATEDEGEEAASPMLQIQRDAAAILQPYFTSTGLVIKALEHASKMEHIMDFTRLRSLSSLFSMLHQACRNVALYNNNHPDFPMPIDQLEKYMQKYLIYAVLWSFSGDSRLKMRAELGEYIRRITTVSLPSAPNVPIIDYEVSITGEWQSWQVKVPQIEVETHKVASPDVVVPTLDTVRHEALLYTWLAEHKPLVLCGPPGSGKTMTLFSALRALPDMEVVGLNFSSATTPELLLKTFDHYCEYRRTPNGVVLAPVQLGKWLVLFCDEINLPDMDKYGTQRVISFIRQMVEHGGFYRTSDQTWVKLERIQFVGACNPPTDPGRKPLSYRFLRHVPVVYVDYPGPASLTQIYGTFNRAMLRLIPSLRTFAEPLTAAMVEFYTMSQERFTQDTQPHYIYSPREMTRWVRGIFEALRPLETLPVEGLIRIWAHEALRLFQDRLVEDEERRWTDENIHMVALKHFPNIDRDKALNRPILYSNWLSKDYVPVEQEELRNYVKARLKVFYEEELDVPLVLFNEVLDHVLRIDRIFRQPQGHLLLIGVSGAGKTTLSRFVAWMNGLTVYQIKVHRKYTGEDFDEDLRTVLRRSGCKNEKIAFIMDESNVLDSGFLERMNTLLANGEVPGLFEGDEYATLMTQCKEGAQKEGLMLDTHEELYKWFTSQVIRNLHVVFTMNPSSEGLKDRAATSPALFNRCVLNWFGDWSTEALYQVGKEFTSKMDLEKPNYKVPDYMPTVYDKLPQLPTHREAIVNGCVFVHQTLHQANNRLAKRGGRTMAITPRHYLDFINHYANLFNEKRSELEEQQMHLNVGLRKIKETVDQVEELRRDLRIKSQELEVKNAAANDKLKKMVKDQQEAEKKKVMSQDIQEAVYKQQEVIKVKQLSVKQDLDQVEPAVIEAQNAVSSIKKQHLVEVRAMANPPAAVKLALESICLLLGEETSDWKKIRQVIIRDNFISSIVNFVSEDTSDSIREKMKKNYMSNPSYNYEQVNRASLACGPMVKWAIAQLNYADMLKRVEPLRNELQKLEDDAKDNKTKAEEVEQMIRDLENSIARYKEEYAVLISEAQAIKADLAAVEAKVNRSTALLKSLSAERERWEKTSETFKNQMSTIAGDCLLSAAFIAYAGYFDQQMRQNLFTTWSHHLQQANIQFRTDIARTEYLSNADERLRWQANSLPADDLCTENAIMLKRFNRYPLIIDPSGQATEFILNEYKDKKITRTSFLDDAFRKNLESALRFGNPLLVQDVESYDPILNPVLNREVRRTGGRVLITLGDQDIDLSPSFVIFLSTRDPTVEFPPDLCSRVTFVNFTVTRSSLQSQCLNEVLKAERPDVDEKRSDLLKLQGEFQLRLRQLEKSLLQALNEVKGRILDDDTIITTLENLKKEAAEVTRKVEETDIVMQEVETVSQQYLSLSSACSSIYFTMEALNQMHFLYQYSLQLFLDIYHTVLYENSNLKSVSDHTQRLSHITKDLFQVAFNRVARGMLHQDHVTFAMLLSRINLKGMTSEPSFDAEFQHFLRGKEIVLSGTTMPKVKGLSSEQSEAMVRLSRLPAFKDLVSKVQADEQFFMWIESNSPELSVPYLWTEEKTSTPIGQAVHQLLLIQAFRPDRLLAMTHIFVSKVMGETFMAIMEQPLDLANIVDSEVKPGTPVLMCSVPGYDASGLVRDLAAEQNKHITSISIGSAEGFNKADRDINTAVKSGRWVMLENVHLAPGWLMQLEKKLHSMQPHACFRLFLTMEINPKVPVNLLRAGRIFVFEPPPGVKANMLRTFSSIPVARMCKSPNERARLYFLLAWFHAVIQERLRYAPLGWSKKYEFGESDLRSACDTVDTWLDDTAKGRQNISPDKIPWAALRTLMAQSIYGGRIDNEFDQRLLNTFLERLFTTSSFDSEFKLALKVDGHKDIKMPDGIRREEFIHWVEMLPDTQTPSWLGLPSNAEKVLLTTQGIDMMGKLLKMQMLEDEDDLAYETEKKQRSTSSSDAQPAWMRTLHTTARNWLQLIPESVSPLKRTVENIKDPLFRFFEREVKMGSRMLQDVRQDLTDVVHVCEGKKKQTNDLRTLINDLVKGILPRSWSRYTVPAAMTVIQWVADFSERIKQLQQISQGAASGGAKELKNIHVNLGGLFVPEAYITATRQYVAQVNSWSLEELCLEVNVTSAQGAALDACSFGIRGLKLQGATCANNKLSLSTSISTELPLTQLHWMKQSNTEKRSMVTLPVYLNFTRSDLIFTVDFDIATKEDPHHFYERGVAVLCTD
ncbi:cytoplasmic dynein 1 heavy chain 1 [Sinocyclocheilus anshuiensis]|uniref:cytoplasmic dynein 1 heavy chain 1 n=1 Tax=Sinocyclocheilus anshuiensis TaxID=1608454 RepID=UPI0007B8E382|nr:PREDICTED: cytoplasmic dynein 1 heavy chain 1 [Sinocyclocheilus anshuiensis]